MGIFWSYLFASGQADTGDIVGTVTDGTGAPLANVKLTITRQNTSAFRETNTKRDGTYTVASLSDGEYSIRAELESFKTQLRQGITVHLGRQEKVDLVLAVGDKTEIVTVQEAPPMLRTTNAELGEVITNDRIVNLPLNGRQFVDLTLLSDNIFKAPRGTRGSALAQTGTAVLVAGQRSGHNMYYLDGVSVTDQYFNHLVASASPDAIGEFSIQKSIYPAEFGGKASATISAVVKSGGNTIHGSGYEFLRNDVFDSRNFFDQDKPPFRQNQFGGTLGGPLRKNQTFFFANYEGQRVKQSQTQTFSVPVASVRGGDFSGLPTIYDPLSSDLMGRRVPLSQNRIPSSRLDPVANAFLPKLPYPNLPGQAQNYLATPTLKNDINQGLIRLDHRLSTNDSLFAHLYVADFDTFQPLGTSLLNESLVPGFGYNLTTHTKSLALGETHVFSPSVVSEFRAAFLRV
ncbi:MAG TPA: carboxypeptidase-like regulatory domain-containing protein, partial [Bryobacteraceae bacterium]